MNRTFAYGDGAYTVNGFPPDRVSVELQNKIQTQDAQDMVDFVKSTDQNLLRRSGRYYQSPLDNFAVMQKNKASIIVWQIIWITILLVLPPDVWQLCLFL